MARLPSVLGFFVRARKILSANLRWLILAIALFCNLSNAFAIDADSLYIKGPRSIDGVSGGEGTSNVSCRVENIEWDPFSSNKDIYWEIDNPVCISFLATSYITVKGAAFASNKVCQNYEADALVAMSAAAGVAFGPDMALQMSKNTQKCAAFWANSQTALAIACCASVAAQAAATGVSLGVLGGIYDIANKAQDNAHICGREWNVWSKQTDDEGNLKWMYGKQASRQQEVEQMVKDGTMDFNIANKSFREYMFGGVEFEDKGDGACELPKSWPAEVQRATLGYAYGDSKSGGNWQNIPYYMRGPGKTPNFACGRFLMANTSRVNDLSDADKRLYLSEGQKAYECCSQRSQETLCISSSNGVSGPANVTEYKFCKLGQRCNVADVWYDVYDSRVVPNHICAKTYSVCPYNHLLGGGTEIAQYDDKGVLVNYCQYLKHCARKPDRIYIRTSNLGGAHISKACFDFKGDSQNVYGYNADQLPVNTRHFSAPIAQCFKETMENAFLNRAGNTKCTNASEKPDVNGYCASGYTYQEGQLLTTPSFFQMIQNNVRSIIKMTLTLAVTLAGLNVFLGGKEWDRKTIMMFVMKLCLVAYFALGDAWHTFFFRVVYTSGDYISQLVMQPDENKPEEKLDGCQFPKFNPLDANEETRYLAQNRAYPEGKEYLRIWDTLDCKIARALGMTPEASVPNLLYIILGGFFTGGLGIVFFVATFFFAFFLLSITVRALHIFLLSSIAIVIMIYVSPITITFAMFKRTEQIFKKWVNNLMGFVFQPIILFAYLGILITVFDAMIIGDMTFSGTGIDVQKKMSCVGPIANKSIYCIFNIADIKTFNGFEALGIGVPMLFEGQLWQEKLYSVITAAFVMFIFAEFLIKISDLASTLVGGATIKGESFDAAKMAAGVGSTLREIQRRGVRAIKKHGGAAASKGAEFGKKVARGMGTRGMAMNKESGAGSTRSGGGDIAVAEPRSAPTPSPDIAVAERKSPAPSAPPPSPRSRGDEGDA